MAIATLFYTRSDLPKEERPGINPSSHGVGVLFGSPKYQVKGELVEGAFWISSSTASHQRSR